MFLEQLGIREKCNCASDNVLKDALAEDMHQFTDVTCDTK